MGSFSGKSLLSLVEVCCYQITLNQFIVIFTQKKETKPVHHITWTQERDSERQKRHKVKERATEVRGKDIKKGKEKRRERKKVKAAHRERLCKDNKGLAIECRIERE